MMRRRTLFGIIFIACGTLKLIDMFHVIHLEWLWSQTWTMYVGPLLLIFIGIEFLSSSYHHHRDQWLQRPLPINDDGKRICCPVAYGGDEYIFRGEAFHGAKLEAFCGAIRMDMRQALITEDEEIDIRTFMGGVELIVPEGLNVIVKSRSFIGGVGNESAICTDEHAHNLYVTASNFMGGVSIKNKY